jgi:hypothetical protein
MCAILILLRDRELTEMGSDELSLNVDSIFNASGTISCDQRVPSMAIGLLHRLYRNAADASWIGEQILPGRN